MEPPSSRALTGCDLQSVAEVAAAISDLGDRYLERVYTVHERSCLARGGAAALAARFAGKEAVAKLIGTTDGIDPRTIEIANDATGRPQANLIGPIARVARSRGIGPIDLSLSYTNDLAMAVAVAQTREARTS